MRPVLTALGVLTLAAAWFGPLPDLEGAPFAAHMVMHMGVVALAAPLLALGLAGGRFDPVLTAPELLAPIPACAVEFAVVWAWHAPALHHAARHTPSGLVLEQGSFLLSGFLVWISALGGRARERPERRGAGILSLLLTSMHMTLLGALLALAPRALYEHHGAAVLTPLQDQQLGGTIMLLAGGLAYSLGGLWLTAGLLKNVLGREP